MNSYIKMYEFIYPVTYEFIHPYEFIYPVTYEFIHPYEFIYPVTYEFIHPAKCMNSYVSDPCLVLKKWPLTEVVGWWVGCGSTYINLIYDFRTVTFV